MKEKLLNIQSKLKAPKNQKNTFGGYNYRSCEDILESVKPILKEEEVILTLSDDIVEVGGRIYVKATAALADGTNKIETSAFAREAESKKGMDEAQVTGAASSYARKYALCGLFAIDDGKDPDSLNNSAEYTKPVKSAQKKEIYKNEWGDLKTFDDFADAITKATSEKQLNALWYRWKDTEFAKDLTQLSKECKAKLLAKQNELIDDEIPDFGIM